MDLIEKSYQRPLLLLPRNDDRSFSEDTSLAERDWVRRKGCSSPD
jgi:hypothetical protein